MVHCTCLMSDEYSLQHTCIGRGRGSCRSRDRSNSHGNGTTAKVSVALEGRRKSQHNMSGDKGAGSLCIGQGREKHKRNEKNGCTRVLEAKDREYQCQTERYGTNDARALIHASSCGCRYAFDCDGRDAAIRGHCHKIGHRPITLHGDQNTQLGSGLPFCREGNALSHKLDTRRGRIHKQRCKRCRACREGCSNHQGQQDHTIHTNSSLASPTEEPGSTHRPHNGS
jgi:hypothetical protein